MRRRIIALLIIAPFMTAIFFYPRWSSNALESNAPQQTRRRGQRRGRAPAQRAAPSRDYSKFSHASPTHRRQECSACHEAPTANSFKVRGFPDVADYPDHQSCMKCHRQQFFSGARPSICAICHTRVSPRDEARFAFPRPSTPRQFTVEFPHALHQDVIASHAPSFLKQGAVRFRNASQTISTQSGDTVRKRYNNCTICHETNAKTPQAPPGGWQDRFVPVAESFKTVPQTHASCFNCHWKNQEPTKDNCAGCHKLSAAPHDGGAGWFKRISVKFTHAREQHTAECTTCHIHITSAETLRGLKPDVPVTSCAACHKTSTDRAAATLETEIEQRKKDPGFTCAKCHTSDVGSGGVPASHSALFSN